MERRTPGYLQLVREKIKREKNKAGKRTCGFEERLESGKENDITKKCLEEMKKRTIRKRVMSK